MYCPGGGGGIHKLGVNGASCPLSNRYQLTNFKTFRDMSIRCYRAYGIKQRCMENPNLVRLQIHVSLSLNHQIK